MEKGKVIESDLFNDFFIVKSIYKSTLGNLVEIVHFREPVEKLVNFDHLLNLVAERMGIEKSKEAVISSLNDYAASSGSVLQNVLRVALSYSYKFGLEVPFLKPIDKYILREEDFTKNSSNFLFENFSRSSFILSKLSSELEKILAGEWYLVKVEDFVAHKLMGWISDTSPRTGLSLQSARIPVWNTEFYANFGTVKLLAKFPTNVTSIFGGDFLLLKGILEEQTNSILVNTIVNLSKNEIWSIVEQSQ